MRLSISVLVAALLFRTFPAEAEPLKIGIIGVPSVGETATVAIAESRADALSKKFTEGIEIIAVPNSCDASNAVDAATRLANEGVSAMTGFFCPEAVEAVISGNYGIPLMIASGDAVWMDSAPAFHIAARPGASEAKAAYFAVQELQPQSILIVRGENAMDTSIWKTSLDSMGIDHDIVTPRDLTSDLGSQYDVIYLEGITDSELRSVDVDLFGDRSNIFAENADANSDTLQFLEERGTEFYYGDTVNPGMTPVISALNSSLLKQGLTGNTQDWMVGVSVDAIVSAASMAGTNDPRAITDQLRSNEIETFFGPLDFSDVGELQTDVTAVFSRRAGDITLRSISRYDCAPGDPNWRI